MKVRTIRFVVLGLNVALLALVGVGARQVFLTRDDPHLPELRVKDLVVRSRSAESSSQFEVIWKELDRVPPPKEPDAPPPPRVSPPEELLRLVLAEDPSSRGDLSCIFQRVGAAEQLVLRVGESADGWTCTSIEADGAYLVATVRGATGVTGKLRVRREAEPSR